MLKETETEETIVFFSEIFIIGSISMKGGPAPLPGYAYGSKCNSLSQQSNCEHGDDF